MMPPSDAFYRELSGEVSRLGFSDFGIIPATRFEEEERHLEAWLKKGFHGEMAYMEANVEKRIDPRQLFPDARSILCVIAHFKDHSSAENKVIAPMTTPKTARFSSYATRADYHTEMKSKLRALFHWIESRCGAVNGRAFVDSAPLMDKAVAKRAGLGWIGKHSNLISPKTGSYFFIGSLVLDIDLTHPVPRPQIKDFCGTCTACLDLCPTKAIVAPFQVDARRCISYLTIELKRAFSDEEKEMIGEWLFGCDICQEVCPWNRFTAQKVLPGLETNDKLRFCSEEEVLSMTSSRFKSLFGETPALRTGLKRLKRNAEAVKDNLHH